ncbi:type VI secretion system protein [Iodobacter sp.]|uniref:type VI secretion system protein n=1 Tax=Iodobacter sp. TaxID=1915058 RepID=UPI0025FD9FF8|nr:type VI secretion system protein [Iodobacter sp.]
MKLLIILLIIVVLLLLWFVLSKMDRLGRGFIDSVKKMEKDSGIEGRYQVPWLLLLGDDQKSAEALCRAWQLKSEEKTAWFGRFWYASDAVVLLPPHDIFMQADGALAALSSWRRLLGALLRVRGQRPIDAVIWAISAERLQAKGEVLQAEIMLCKQFQDAQQKLGQTLPVYWLITGLQEMAGGKELIESLPDQAQDCALGWSSTLPLASTYQRECLDKAISQLQNQLGDCIGEIGALNGGVSDALFLLPRQFDALRAPLQALGDAAFQSNALGDAPVLRGLYFVGAYQPPQDDMDGFAPVGSQVTETPIFAARLLRQRIAAERGLAQPIVRIMSLRQRWHRYACIGMGVFCAVWLLAMVWIWQNERQEAITLNHLLSELGSGQSEVQTEDDPASQAASGLWSVLTNAPRLHFASFVFPGAWFSSFDQDLDKKVASLFKTQWFASLYDQLQIDLALLQAEGTNSDITSGDSTSSPENWPRYVSAQRLMQQASLLEQDVILYNRALRGGSDALSSMANLSNRLWETDFHPDRLHLRAKLENVLQQYAPEMGKLIRLQDVAKETEQHFAELMKRWLDRLYADTTFTEMADNVQTHLTELQSDNRNSYAELDTLQRQIALLRRLIAASNSAWSSASGQDLVPGYSALLNHARSSSFVGKEVVQQIEAHASSVRKAFQERWSNQDSSLTAQGAVGIREEVVQLQSAIHYLLEQDFVVQARSASLKAAVLGSLKGMNAETLNTAMENYQSRQHYQAQILPKVPDLYRSALGDLASKSTAITMWHILGGLVADEAQSRADDSLDGLIHAAPAISVAFIDLGRSDLSNELNREITERALQSLRQADAQLAELALYQPKQATFSWWDGKKNASYKAFKASNPLELQQYLARQLEQLASVAINQGMVLEWLAAHPKGVPVKDMQMIMRWRSLALDLKKFKEKAPDSGVILLAQLISKELNEMDVNTCHSVLQQLELPAGPGYFFERAQRLVNLANERCTGLRAQSSAYAWQQLAPYFNQYLAGRFPFAANTGAADADVERVSVLMRLIDSYLPIALAGVDEGDAANMQAARLYLQGLQNARELLGPLLLRGTVEQPQPLGVDIDVQWRSDKDKEQGADQVIEWSLGLGAQRLRYPQGERAKLRWLLGQPVTFALRWAKDSPRLPAEDALQSDLMVSEQTAEWRYGGAWSLLRFLRNHQAPAGMVFQDEFAYPALLFSLPIHGPSKDNPHAQMFARFGISAVGAKTLLPLHLINALPLKAPASPFRQITMPDSKTVAELK